MIQNLSTYNAWKRSTLDRTAGHYRTKLIEVLAVNLRLNQHQIVSALRSGARSVSVGEGNLDRDLKKVFLDHQRQTIHVAVSDGIREVTPEKEFSTWTKWPWHYPVENTFVSLADKNKRDKIVKPIFETIEGANARKIKANVTSVKNKYLSLLQRTFRMFSKDYFADADTDVTRDLVKDIIGHTLEVNKPHAEMIFRTETTRYFNDARVAYFQENTDVDFVQLIAVTDGRISNICESRDGYVVPLEKAELKQFKPPFHPNCRTIQSPLDTDLKSDVEEVRRNLGSEFGVVHSDTSDKDFTGGRAAPRVPLPKGWN